MKICIVGVGYVGLVTGVCLADFGLDVTCVDVDNNKINLLKNGQSPIYEPGIGEYLSRGIKNKKLTFTTDLDKALSLTEVVFIAVGTPSNEQGKAEMSSVFQVAKDIGKLASGDLVVAIKSTVPVGTNKKVDLIIKQEFIKRNCNFKVSVVSNPEFLREGKAIQDFTHPDKVVIGSNDEHAIATIKKLYKPIYIGETPYLICSIESAELVKYANNAFLATKISFMNEMANLCEQVGANIKDIEKALGKDGRISPKFLHAGPGFGGSCFPKDLKALVVTGDEFASPMTIINTVSKANIKQKKNVVNKLLKYFDNLDGKTICLLGLTFKPETDDIRQASAIVVISDLLEKNALVNVYDPKGNKSMKKVFPSINCFTTAKQAISESDALIILTEWNEFRNLDLTEVKSLLKGNIFYDSRNLYDKETVKENGFIYIGTGV